MDLRDHPNLMTLRNRLRHALGHDVTVTGCHCGQGDITGELIGFEIARYLPPLTMRIQLPPITLEDIT
jgi:hypothetical protein